MKSSATLDARFMTQALREAHKGHPSPNPHVGAVLVRGGKVIAVGHHPRAGGPHAEVVVLRKAGKRARGATLYVTLEPCNHYGQTPPCTEAIIAADVARVVAGCPDPLPHVQGSTARLRRAGIAVHSGVCRQAAQELIADFKKFRVRKLPYVTLKAAITLDGRLATRSGDSKWITSKAARRHVHAMRAQSDAVLVGVGTALADNPELNVRLARGPNPLRVVLDTRLRLPLQSKLAKVKPSLRTLVFHGPRADKRRRSALLAKGVELVQIPVDRHGRLRLPAMLRELARRDVVRLLVEGGSQVHGAFLDAGLVDRAALFVAPRLLADADALPLASGKARLRMAHAIELESPTVQRFGPDILVEGPIQSARR